MEAEQREAPRGGLLSARMVANEKIKSTTKKKSTKEKQERQW